MDTPTVAFAVIGIGVAAALGFLILRRARREDAAQNWPSAEATIQSAAIEEVGSRYKDLLPCFAFSYVVDGEYFSGRFCLYVKGDRADALIKDMIDAKLTVQYDPQKPERFSIPDESIEDCEVRLIPD